MAKMIRIKDVAEAVGVSTATVSNVINGKDQPIYNLTSVKQSFLFFTSQELVRSSLPSSW